MIERTAKYSRCTVEVMSCILNTVPELEKEKYKQALVEEIGKYSFEKREKGKPRNEGCVNELADITTFDISNPEHVGKWIKETAHMLYNKDKAKIFLDTILANIN